MNRSGMMQIINELCHAEDIYWFGEKKTLTPENDTATIYSLGPCWTGHFYGT
jgi:hypothetical protein